MSETTESRFERGFRFGFHMCKYFSTKLTSYCIRVIAAKRIVKLLCHLQDLWITRNAEIICHELIVMTRVAGDTQSSNQRSALFFETTANLDQNSSKNLFWKGF